MLVIMIFTTNQGNGNTKYSEENGDKHTQMYYALKIPAPNSFLSNSLRCSFQLRKKAIITLFYCI